MDVIDKINKSKKIWEILPTLTVDEIERAIKVSAESYYNSDTPLLTDEIYDMLVFRLEQLNPKSKIFEHIGAPVKGKKKELPVWMGSMNKIKENQKLIDKWTNEYPGPYVVSDKLDGISCLLTWVNQKLNLYTRGDGQFGQDITHLAKFINLPINKLQNDKRKIYLRGELIMSKDKFEKYADHMSSARSMVAGTVNSKKESLNLNYARDIDYLAYEVVEPSMTPSKQMKFIKTLGIPVVYYDIYDTISINILDDILQKRKKKSIYEIDGIIVTDDAIYPKITSGNPSYSFAYKGLTETANTKVLEVVWVPSKDGYLVPTIYYEKVRLSQADLTSTLGFNGKFIVDNMIGPGAIITVIRSNDVIPYILGVIKPAKKPGLPTNLDYKWDDTKVNIILKNPDQNYMVIVKRLTKFVNDIGVDNLSQGLIERLVKSGYDSIPKLMSLTIDDLLEIEGFQKTLANKIYHNLSYALDNLDILKLMVSSNVFGRGFGTRKIKKVLDQYPNIVHEYSKKSHKIWAERLLDLEGFSQISVDSFLNSLRSFQKFYDEVVQIVDVKPYKKNVKKKGMFKDQIIVFTGFRNKDWEKFIEHEGGRLSNSVSKKTSLLVFNDGESFSAKYKKAKELRIKTMSKSEFASFYNL